MARALPSWNAHGVTIGIALFTGGDTPLRRAHPRLQVARAHTKAAGYGRPRLETLPTGATGSGIRHTSSSSFGHCPAAAAAALAAPGATTENSNRRPQRSASSGVRKAAGASWGTVNMKPQKSDCRVASCASSYARRMPGAAVARRAAAAGSHSRVTCSSVSRTTTTYSRAVVLGRAWNSASFIMVTGNGVMIRHAHGGGGGGQLLADTGGARGTGGVPSRSNEDRLVLSFGLDYPKRWTGAHTSLCAPLVCQPPYVSLDERQCWQCGQRGCSCGYERCGLLVVL